MARKVREVPEVSTAIKIDVDWLPPGKEGLDWADERLELMKEIVKRYGYKIVSATYTLSARGIHFIIVVEGRLDPKELLKLQWLLGDDATRCEINFRRLQRGRFPERNILFEKVLWRRPPTEKCLKCKLWRLYQKHIKAREPPGWVAIFEVRDEELLSKALVVLGEIYNKDPTFWYEVEGFEVKIYAGDRDTAIKRGLWFKHKVFEGKINFDVRPMEIPEEDLIEENNGDSN